MPSANESANDISKFRLQQLKSTTPAGGSGGRAPNPISVGNFGGSSAGVTGPRIGSRPPAPTGTPGGVGVRFRVPLAKGGSADMAQDKAMVTKAVHKHESAMHKGKPKTKLAKGGSASKRADGCCSKGKTKGRFV